MKLKAQLTDTAHDVSLKLADGTATCEVEGRQYELEVRQMGSGEYLLIDGSNVYKCRVESKRASLAGSGSFAVVVRGQSYDVVVIDPKRLRGSQSAGAHHTGAAEIISPMPGKIVRVLVAVGARVEVGAGVVVVEAMKMQNEMKAPKAGVIISINAAEGATVRAGDVLAVIE